MEAKRARRRRRLGKRSPAQREGRERRHTDRVLFGEQQLARLGEPLVKRSKQRQKALDKEAAAKRKARGQTPTVRDLVDRVLDRASA